jgi:hypothetical protein
LPGLLGGAYRRRHWLRDVDAAQQLAGARTEIPAGQAAYPATAAQAAALPGPGAGATLGAHLSAARLRGRLSRYLVLPGQAPRRVGLCRLLPRQFVGALAGRRLLGALVGFALVGQLPGALLLGQLLASSLFHALLLG